MSSVGDKSWLNPEVLLHNQKVLSEPAGPKHVNNVINNVIIPTDEDESREDIPPEDGPELKELPDEIQDQDEDTFPGDDLENEPIATILFNLLDFYPTTNIVEAYLRSKNRTSRRNNLQVLQLWELYRISYPFWWLCTPSLSYFCC